MAFNHVLELSSKSGNKLSFLLSPLSLQLTMRMMANSIVSKTPFKKASKDFWAWRPLCRLALSAPKTGQKDERLTTSGALIGYNYFGMEWA